MFKDIDRTLFFLFLAEYMTLDRGTKLLVFQGHTYGRNSKIRMGGIRYRCSSALSKGCKACVHVSKDDVIISAFGNHNHIPKTYMKIADGRYIKV